MEKSFTEIIRSGLWNGDSYEVINKKLKEAGATFSLVKDREHEGWTPEEMASGFIEQPVGEDVKTLADLMARNMEYAGYTKRLTCKQGTFDVTYEADGYATRAVRV